MMFLIQDATYPVTSTEPTGMLAVAIVFRDCGGIKVSGVVVVVVVVVKRCFVFCYFGRCMS